MGLARESYAALPGGGRGGLQLSDADLVTRLWALVKRHGGWGFWKYHYRLRKLGVLANHKHLWLIYQNRSSQLGKRRKKKRLPERVKRPL